MRSFEEIFEIAAARHGGTTTLEGLLSKPLPIEELRGIGDDRWLSAMAKCLFQAGFAWKVVDAKWPDFETCFHGFNPAAVAAFTDEDIEGLLSDRRVIRNGMKLKAVVQNAAFLREVAAEHGSASTYFADWPTETHADFLALLAKRGSRLGALTGQRVPRWVGKDAYVLSQDVVARLIAENVIDKPPGGKRAMMAVQEAFNMWRAESGRSLTEISQVLARSTGP